MDIPEGWKAGQKIEIFRGGDYIVVEPDISFTEEFNPNTVILTFYKSDYGKFRDWIKEWLQV